MNRRSHTYVLKSLDCVDDQKGFVAYCSMKVYMIHPSNLARLPSYEPPGVCPGQFCCQPPSGAGYELSSLIVLDQEH